MHTFRITINTRRVALVATLAVLLTAAAVLIVPRLSSTSATDLCAGPRADAIHSAQIFIAPMGLPHAQAQQQIRQLAQATLNLNATDPTSPLRGLSCSL